MSLLSFTELHFFFWADFVFRVVCGSRISVAMPIPMTFVYFCFSILPDIQIRLLWLSGGEAMAVCFVLIKLNLEPHNRVQSLETTLGCHRTRKTAVTSKFRDDMAAAVAVCVCLFWFLCAGEFSFFLCCFGCCHRYLIVILSNLYSDIWANLVLFFRHDFISKISYSVMNKLIWNDKWIHFGKLIVFYRLNVSCNSDE